MVLFFPTSDFFESSGNAAAEFQENLRDAIVSHACSLWSAYPTFITNGRNPASSFARGFMNQACSSVNPSPPPVDLPFTGGQCPTRYAIFVEFDVIPQGSTTPQPRRELCFQNINGPIQSLTSDVDNNANTVTVTLVSPQTPNGTGVAFNTPSNSTVPENSVVFDVIRQDGQPDDCGDPPLEYPPETPPQPADLNTTINITNIDGFDTVYDLTWNQTNNNYNFPFNFKLNGVNVNLSVSGLTIYGDPGATSINGDNESEPPGSDGGKDSDGNDYTIIYPDQDYPEPPLFTQVDLVDTVLDYILCQDGVIEELTSNIKLPPGNALWVKLILDLLVNLLREICTENQTEVGLPEIYPVLPGVDRPIVMLYYKVVVNGEKEPSTFVATIPHPSAATIANLENLSPPDRVLGRYVCSLKLTDGSRIVARGDSPIEAENQFNYMLGLVDPTFIPNQIENFKVLTENPKLQTHSVKCTQIEYYPDGKSFARSPDLRIFLSVTD